MNFSPLIANVGISLKLNTNLFGTDCNLYFPKGIDNNSQLMDENITYDSEPDVSQKILLPFIFQFTKSKAFVGDLYAADEPLIYATAEDMENYPMGTLIEFSFNKKIYTYKIFDSESFDSPQGSIIYRITLIPHNTIEPSELFMDEVYKDREELLEVIREEVDVKLDVQANNKDLYKEDEPDSVDEEDITPSGLSFGTLKKD